MQDEILKRLDALAAKLGVVTSHLWAVLVRQAVVEGWLLVGVGLFLLILLACAVRGGFLCWARFEADEKSWRSGWDTGAVILWVGAAIVLIPLVVCFASGILQIANPEYYALQSILHP